MSHYNFTNQEFAEYLDRVGSDYLESGSNATATDYFEAARRIIELTTQLEKISISAGTTADIV